MNSIGPLWDGNEVWLVTFGGALFAAFPRRMRRSSRASTPRSCCSSSPSSSAPCPWSSAPRSRPPGWRRVWDWSFFGGSALATLLFGVAVGNAMKGMPLDEGGNVLVGVLDQLAPYPVLVGLMTVALFALHGGLFLYLKTEGEFQQRLRDWMWRSFGVFLVTYMLTTMATLAMIPRATANFEHYPLAALVVVVNVLAIANIPRCLYWNRPAQAFLSSAVTIVTLVALFGLALFPNLVTASNDPELSVTVFNAASSPRTLTIMLVIAACGLPFVLAYTGVIYWTFRGRVSWTRRATRGRSGLPERVFPIPFEQWSAGLTRAQ